MSTTKTYESLQELNSSSAAVYGKNLAIKIVQCSALLPNHMQCWRASDVLITTETPAPTEDNPNAVSKTQTQMCNRHAVMDQQAYLKAQQDEQAVETAQAAVAADTATEAKAPVVAATTLKK